MPPIVAGDSFCFLRTVGARVAPEVLVLELFREVFYRAPLGAGVAQAIDPFSDASISTGERAVLALSRGRARMAPGKAGQEFYAPVYLEQARLGWLRKQSDRTVRDHLFNGAIAQYLRDSRDVDGHAYVVRIVSALDGARRRKALDGGSGELLDIAASQSCVDLGETVYEPETATRRILDEMRNDRCADLPPKLSDPLARRIALDFEALAALELDMPRLQWLDMLKTFLRLAISSWVLAQSKTTVLLHRWCRACVAGQPVPSLNEICRALVARNASLFHPVGTGADELDFHVEQYVRARVEISLMMNLAHELTGLDIHEKQLTVNSRGAKTLTVEQLLAKIRELGVALREEFPRLEPSQVIARLAENFSAWSNPLSAGQGKNIREFLRVLIRLERVEDDEGYLVTRKRRGIGRDRVFPGPLLVKVMVALTAADKLRSGGTGGGGKPVLADVENHFSIYGVDFSASAGARPLLIEELSRLGLLSGSPDAGESAEVFVPFKLTNLA